MLQAQIITKGTDSHDSQAPHSDDNLKMASLIQDNNNGSFMATPPSIRSYSSHPGTEDEVHSPNNFDNPESMSMDEDKENLGDNLLINNDQTIIKNDTIENEEDEEEDEDSKLYSLAAALVSIANSPVTHSLSLSTNHSNSSGSDTGDFFVQAYAKIEGPGWTHFMKKPTCLFGKAPTPHQVFQPSLNHSELVDFYLACDNEISEKHLLIRYSPDNLAWELVCMGKSGCIVDSIVMEPFGVPIPLRPNSVITLGHGKNEEKINNLLSFRFILPGPEELASSRSTTPPSSETDRTIRRLHGRSTSASSTSSTSSTSHWKSYDPTKPPGSSRRGSRRLKEKDAFPASGGSGAGSGGGTTATIKDELTKPSQSYACLIAEAINSVPERRMTLSGIYQYLADNYPYFRQTKNGWQNSVRHNLSLNKAFKKVPRDIGEQGKGMFWVVDTDFEHLVKGSTGRRTASRSRPSTPISMEGNVIPVLDLNTLNRALNTSNINNNNNGGIVGNNPGSNQSSGGNQGSSFTLHLKNPYFGNSNNTINTRPMSASPSIVPSSSSASLSMQHHFQILPKPLSRFPVIQPYPNSTNGSNGSNPSNIALTNSNNNICTDSTGVVCPDISTTTATITTDPQEITGPRD